MACLRSPLQRLLTTSTFPVAKISRFDAILAALLVSAACLAQQAAPAGDQLAANGSPSETPSIVTIPAGTRLALVLIQPVETRYIRRGDDIYAQITSPVNSANEVVIPRGTFVQGTVDKIERNGGRAEIRLQAMAITFPDGYVIPITGPMTLESSDGYAIRDPGSKRVAGAIALPLAGLGIGALIGHSAGSSQSSLTNTLPPGCVGPPPGCLSSTMSTPGTAGKDAAIGAVIGGATGALASMFLLFSSHHFYLDAGSPVQAMLQQPVTLQQNEVATAVRQSEDHPAPQQAVAPRPLPPTPLDTGICWTPGTPGTPPTMIPGVPGPDGIPGPPTIIPGTPPTPGTPYPCP